MVSCGESPEEGFNWKSTLVGDILKKMSLLPGEKTFYLNAGWKGKEGGLEGFFCWNIDLTGGQIIPSWGSKIWWGKRVSPKWDLNLSYQFSEVQGESPLSFDPQDQKIFPWIPAREITKKVFYDYGEIITSMKEIGRRVNCWGRIRGDEDLSLGVGRDLFF